MLQIIEKRAAPRHVSTTCRTESPGPRPTEGCGPADCLPAEGNARLQGHRGLSAGLRRGLEKVETAGGAAGEVAEAGRMGRSTHRCSHAVRAAPRAPPGTRALPRTGDVSLRYQQHKRCSHITQRHMG